MRTKVVNGYSTGGGLEFSREVNSPNEHKCAIRDAWDTPHVVDVATWEFDSPCPTSATKPAFSEQEVTA